MRKQAFLPIAAAIAFAPTFAVADDASVDTSTTGSLSAKISALDLNSDGSVGVDELNMAVQSGQVACSADGLSGLFGGLGEVDEASAATADDIKIVSVRDCEPADIQASLGSEDSNNIRLMLSANNHVTAALQANGARIEDVLQVGEAGTSLIVFVPATPLNVVDE